MSATDFLRKKFLDTYTGVASYGWPALYLALFTADPTELGSLVNEVSGGGYARLSLAGIMGAADSTGSAVNTSLISIGPASAPWGQVSFLGITDALTSGNMTWPGVPATPRTINTGQSFQIPAGQLFLRAR